MSDSKVSSPGTVPSPRTLSCILLLNKVGRKAGDNIHDDLKQIFFKKTTTSKIQLQTRKPVPKMTIATARHNHDKAERRTSFQA